MRTGALAVLHHMVHSSQALHFEELLHKRQLALVLLQIPPLQQFRCCLCELVIMRLPFPLQTNGFHIRQEKQTSGKESEASLWQE